MNLALQNVQVCLNTIIYICCKPIKRVHGHSFEVVSVCTNTTMFTICILVKLVSMSNVCMVKCLNAVSIYGKTIF